jgi:hypothetical protein
LIAERCIADFRSCFIDTQPRATGLPIPKLINLGDFSSSSQYEGLDDACNEWLNRLDTFEYLLQKISEGRNTNTHPISN